jgi:hypothetical protein
MGEATAAGISAVCSKTEPVTHLLEKAKALAGTHAELLH